MTQALSSMKRVQQTAQLRNVCFIFSGFILFFEQSKLIIPLLAPSLNPEVLKLNEWKEQFHNSLQYIQEEIIIHLLQKDASVDEIGVLIRKTISELKMSVSELLNMMASLIRKYVQKSRLDLENSNSYWHGVVIDLNNQIEHLTRIAAIEEERRKNSESEIKRLKKYISMLRSERSTMKKEMKDAQIPIIQTGESNNDAKNSLSAKEVQEKNNIERLRGKPVNVKQSPRPEARDQSSKKNIEKKGGVSKGMERSSPEHISPTINPEKVQEQKDQAARTENEDKRKPDIILEDKKDIPVQISENERVVEEETTTADEKQGFEKSSGESEQQALSQEQTVSQQKGNNSEPEQILSRKELLRLKMQNKRAGRVRGVESVISNAETDSSASSNFITDRGVDEEVRSEMRTFFSGHI